MSDPTDLGDAAKALHELSQHRGWPALHAAYERSRTKYVERLTSTLLRDRAEADQRDIDYHAGYFQAWADLLAEPEKAERRFERAARRDERNV